MIFSLIQERSDCAKTEVYDILDSVLTSNIIVSFGEYSATE